MKKYLGWIAFFALFTICQVFALQFGQRMADRQSYAEGMCKIDGLWNTAKICKEKGVKGSVWSNYDGTYRAS